jgi:pantoate--beta-alanine ligase
MFPIEIVVAPIVREADGLALSSRNVYLSVHERRQALLLSRALREIQSRYRAGERDASKLIEAARSVFAVEPAVRVDYIALVDPETMEDVATASAGTLAAVAAFVGATRLIDNLILD